MRETRLVARGLSVVLGGRTVVRGVDLVARSGEVLALLGPNGAGKSTILRALAGLVPSAGEIDVGGRPLRGMAADERARALAYVPQQSRLDAPLRVREVVRQGRHAWARRVPAADDLRIVDRAMDAASVLGLAESRFTEISHGERRRVLVARALATGAEVILLDEPTAGLDVGHALGCLDLLRRIAAEGAAVIAVLHQLDEARGAADRALLLDGGEALASGPVDEVIAAGPVRQAYGVELVPGGGLGFAVLRP